MVNDDLPGRIVSGRVQLKPNVKEFCGSNVVFVDGSIIEKVCIHTFSAVDYLVEIYNQKAMFMVL